MKKIKMIAICMSLAATLSMVGCVCGPGGYYAGASQAYYPGVSGCGDMSCGDMACDTGCDPCDPCEMPMDCGVIECAPSPCFASPMINCRTSFSNIGNGVCLLGRGVLDATAAPFIVVGRVLSSGCRYNVSVDCGEMYCGPVCETVTPCSSCGSTGTSGCANCSEGFTEGIEYDTTAKNRPVLAAPRKHTVVQAVYQEPTTPPVKFVQPK